MNPSTVTNAANMVQPMSVLELIAGIVLIILSIVVILIVMMQEGRDSGMGVINGSDSFQDKGRARTLNAFLAKWTKWIAIVFFVLILATMLICNL